MGIYNKEDLYRDYYPKVLGYLHNHIVLKDDAEDLAQTVFLKVYSKFDTYDETKSSVSTWIFNIMRNTLIDYQRKNSVHLEAELSETIASYDEDLSDVFIHEEELGNLANALERLEEKERDMIILHYYKEYTLMKISEIMGLSYGQAKRLNAKALDKLSVYMNL